MSLYKKVKLKWKKKNTVLLVPSLLLFFATSRSENWLWKGRQRRDDDKLGWF